MFKSPVKGELTIVISEKKTKDKSLDKEEIIKMARKYLKKYSLKDSVDLIYEKEKQNRKEIYKLEEIGYSHIDIAVQLYRYIVHESKDIDCAVELGLLIDHLNNFQHDPYSL